MDLKSVFGEFQLLGTVVKFAIYDISPDCVQNNFLKTKR